MREILFRGKRDDGKWLYGSLVTGLFGEEGEQAHILDPDNGYYDCFDHFDSPDYEVDPETVGQFTGLTDKNGTMIFEGDIVKYAEGFHHWSGAYETPTFVEYECGGFYPFAGEGEYVMSSEYAIIIGNIHDNPELLP